MTVSEPKWWGTNPSPELAALIGIFHDALFAEDDAEGPIFRWSEQRIAYDDDTYLKIAADQMAFAVLDHADEVVALIATVRARGELDGRILAWDRAKAGQRRESVGPVDDL